MESSLAVFETKLTWFNCYVKFRLSGVILERESSAPPEVRVAWIEAKPTETHKSRLEYLSRLLGVPAFRNYCFSEHVHAAKSYSVGSYFYYCLA